MKHFEGTLHILSLCKEQFDVAAAMLLVKNKSISLPWELGFICM